MSSAPEPESVARAGASVSSGLVAGALAGDLVATAVFIAVGRGSHNEDATLLGFLASWWPFAVALLAGWCLSLAWRRPAGVVRPGIQIWAVTLGGGMLLRALSGQGVAIAFVIVASAFLALTLIGWRLVFALIRRRNRAV